MAKARALLEFRSISKAFGSFFANQDVSFSVKKGTIHALVGENGAGKSTLMKILFGLYPRTSGEIFLNGEKCNFNSPLEAKAFGLGMVHQHFMLAGPICALDHIILDQRKKITRMENLFFPVDRKRVLNEIDKISKDFKMPVPWLAAVESLSVGIQQRIEILKLLYNQAEILILDEPTAVLTPQEITVFFEQLKDLKNKGTTIIIITHKLKEVLALADEVTVLRQGHVVYSGAMRGHSIESLSELMIGRRLMPAHSELTSTKNSKIILQTQKLSYVKDDQKFLNKIEILVRENEIVGIAGVEGNGQSQLLDILIRPKQVVGEITGEVLLSGRSILALATDKIRSFKMNYFPEDRLRQALLLDLPAAENFVLGQQHSRKFQKWGWLNWKRISASVLKVFSDFDVRPQNLDLPLRQFSGGNQQKFVVGRELSQNPKMLIAAQPTRGVDVGAIESIHKELIKLKDQGAGVLLISSDLDEIMKLSDRIYVMFRGQIAAEFKAENFSEKTIGAYMAGLSI